MDATALSDQYYLTNVRVTGPTLCFTTTRWSSSRRTQNMKPAELGLILDESADTKT